MYNPIDSSYKKAIEICGVKATINNTDTKILIRDTTAPYGIDYKKIISSQDLKQGDYVFINGVQYLIYDIDEQMSQSIYNVGTFRKTMEIKLGKELKPVKAIVDKYKGVFVEGQYLNEVHDQYNFIFPRDSGSLSQLIYNGGLYQILSTDVTRDGIVVITGKFSETYNPHSYTISLNATSDSVYETATYQLTAIAKDNGTSDSSPIVTWSSSDETIATVNNGLVTGVKAGSATITATYMNESATFVLTVNVKPVEPVLSYSTTWSNNNATLLRLASSSTVIVVKNIDGITDSNLIVNYNGDSVFNSLLSAKKISITKISDSSFTIKNTNTTSSYTITITLTDSSNGKVIEVKTIKLAGV